MNIRAKSHKKKLLFTIAILSLFCLDLVTYIPGVPVSVSKSIVLLISAICFLRLGKYDSQRPKHDMVDMMIVVYTIMLFIRLIIDFVIKGQTFFVYSHTISLFVFVLGIIYIPFYSVRNVKIELDINKLTYGIYIVLLVCMMLSAMNISGGQAEEVSGGRFDANEGIFSILYGHLGVSLIFASFCLKFTSVLKKIRLPLTLLGIFVGFVSLIYSGSRGPFVALMLGFLLYLTLFQKNKNVSYAFIIGFILIILNIVPILTALNDFLESFNIYSFNRVASTIGIEHETGREDLWIIALADFIESPFWGVSYLFENGTYVHNIFVEQFRALGLFGGLCFLIFNIVLAFRGYNMCRINTNYLLFYLLYIQYMVMGLFTSTIIVLSQYWVFMIIVFNLCNNEKSIGYNSNVSQPRRSC